MERDVMKKLTIEITNRCSLKCPQCSTEEGNDGKVFVSMKSVAESLERFPDFKAVRISGGEPFMHPEIVGLAKLVHEQNRRVQILSCGVWYHKPIPKSLMLEISPYADEIIFSMQGYYSQHDSIVTSDKDWLSHPPYWDMLCDTVDNTILAGIPISFQTVVMKSNYDYLRDIALCVSGISRASDQGVDWRILRFVKQGRGAIHPDQALDAEQMQGLAKRIKELSNEFGISITCSNSFEQKRCGCGSEKAVVTYDGEIIPCSALKHGSDAKGKFQCRNRI